MLNVQELASELKISKSGLYQWVSQKKIPFVKIGRSVRFDPDEIKKWLNEKKIKPLDI